MKKVDLYRETLGALEEWDDYLLRESGLPGPRGNLELAHVVAELGSRDLFERYLGFDAQCAPVNSPAEFLAFCGVVGMGRLLAEGQRDTLEVIRTHANDPRWRTREAAAMALQRWGRADMEALLAEMERWAGGSLLERRAVVAGLCEPDLLAREEHARRVLSILDGITQAILSIPERKGEDFQVLRKGLGYGWSVAVAALPEQGIALLEKWSACPDPDVTWIMRENWKKNRLKKLTRGT